MFFIYPCSRFVGQITVSPYLSQIPSPYNIPLMCYTLYMPKKNRHVDGLYVDCGIPRFPTPRKRHFTTWNILSCSICPQKNHSLGEIPRFSWYQMSINFPFPPGHPLGTCAPCFPEMGHRSSPFASDTASGALALPRCRRPSMAISSPGAAKSAENMVKTWWNSCRHNTTCLDSD